MGSELTISTPARSKGPHRLSLEWISRLIYQSSLILLVLYFLPLIYTLRLAFLWACLDIMYYAIYPLTLQNPDSFMLRVFKIRYKGARMEAHSVRGGSRQRLVSLSRGYEVCPLMLTIG